MNTVAPLVDTLLLHLAWTSLQASLLIGLLWLLGRALPRLPTPTRCLLWWLLGAQLLIGLAWQAPLRLPLLPPAPVTVATTQPSRVIVRAGMQATPASVPAVAHADTASAGIALSWREALVAMWLAGVLAQLARVARRWQRTRHVRRGSRALNDPVLEAVCTDQAQRLGLRRCPELRCSDAIDSPQVTGLVHPVVLLPAHAALAPGEQAMALAHELAHVRRGDLWLGWVPALAKGLFFFHPLVRLAMREYALHREAACDSTAVRLQRSAPQAYGRLLLRLGIERPEPVGLAGVASPSLQQLKRRLAMLQHAAHATPHARDWLLVALVALACVVPYRVVEAGGETPVTHHAARSSDLALIPPPPAPPSTVGAKDADDAGTDAATDKQACGVGADNIRFCGATFLWYAKSPDPGQAVVLFDRQRVIIHGTHADVVAANHFYEPGATALWFRRGDKAWVTHNEGIIQRARRIYAPTLKSMRQIDELTTENGALTDKQSAITLQQAAFAQKLASLAQQRAALARTRASLAQRRASVARQAIAMQRGSAGVTNEAASARLEAKRKAIATQRHALDAKQRALDARHAKLDRQHAALEARLDRQRKALAAQRSVLTRQRDALQQRRTQAADHAHQAMRKLLDDVLAEGLATRASRG